MIERIHWLGHASFRIEGDPVVYIDPWKIASRALSAGLVLVTHGHYDHLSKTDIDKVCTRSTTIVLPHACAATFNRKAEAIKVGERLEVAGIVVEAVPSYNKDKPFHPRDSGWLGYLVHFPEATVYHAGDSDLIDEMNDFEADIALLPVGGTYTMKAEEAVEAAKRVKASIAVPMHWGDVVGSRADAEKFVRLAVEAGIDARLLEAER